METKLGKTGMRVRIRNKHKTEALVKMEFATEFDVLFAFIGTF